MIPQHFYDIIIKIVFAIYLYVSIVYIKDLKSKLKLLEAKKDASDLHFINATIKVVSICLISLARQKKTIENRAELEQEFNAIGDKIASIMPDVKCQVIKDVLILVYKGCFNIHV
jgi:hypothetical protein